MKYTDPDGRVVAVDDAIIVIGLIILYAISKTAADNYNSNSSSREIIGDDLSGNADLTKNKKSNSANPSPMPKNGAVSAAPGSPAPNGNYNKSSRNKPKEKGNPNGIEVERNPDGSVKRITQYDGNGNFQKEIRPNPKGQHGVKGPTTKEPHYNTTPDGRIFRNGYIVRPATPEEINLLNSF